jgi:hypothetical protein
MDTSKENQTWLQRNQKAILIGGIVIVALLLIIPDVYLRKYVPFVK